MTASPTNYVAQLLSRLYPHSSPIHRGVVDSAAAYGSTDLGSIPALALARFVISNISDKVKTRPTRERTGAPSVELAKYASPLLKYVSSLLQYMSP